MPPIRTVIDEVTEVGRTLYDQLRELVNDVESPTLAWREGFPATMDGGTPQPTSGSPGNWGYSAVYGRLDGGEVVETFDNVNGRHYMVTSGSSIYYAPTPADEAQRLQWEAHRREAEERYKREVDAQRAAEERSLELLREFLSPIQRKQFDHDPEFIVVAKSGRRYKIKPRQQVREIDRDGYEVMAYCIAPNAQLPTGDVMLAQKLMLETNEAEFQRIANRITIAGRTR